MKEEIDWLDELYQIKQQIASEYSSFREFFDALVRRQNQAHPEFAAVVSA